VLLQTFEWRHIPLSAPRRRVHLNSSIFLYTFCYPPRNTNPVIFARISSFHSVHLLDGEATGDPSRDLPGVFLWLFRLHGWIYVWVRMNAGVL
jgi:hypothetical protein